MNIDSIMNMSLSPIVIVYVITAIMTIISARIADMIKDANAIKNGDINDGKGYPIEGIMIPILVGFLMIPFVWMAMSLVEMNWQTALVTSVSFGFVSRELLVTKIAKVVGE